MLCRQDIAIYFGQDNLFWFGTVFKLFQVEFNSNFKKCVLLKSIFDVEFERARAARDENDNVYRKTRQKKSSAAALTSDEYTQIVQIQDENVPLGLQRNVFHLISREQAQRSGERVTAKVDNFIKNLDHERNFAGRYEYSFYKNNSRRI